jgi:hypothetical protein
LLGHLEAAENVSRDAKGASIARLVCMVDFALWVLVSYDAHDGSAVELKIVISP